VTGGSQARSADEGTGEPAIRAVVADQHAATRMGVRTALEAANIVVCAEAADAAATVAAVLEHVPDVCLMDIRLPGDGMAAAGQIADDAPGTAIVVLTDSDDPQHLISALRAGARGYLLKDTDPARLPAAIRGVLRGESAIPRTLVPHLVDAIAGRRRDRLGGLGLTEREYEVLDAFASGARTRDVAQRLGLAEGTVRRHTASAVAKLGAATRQEAIARFRDAGRPQN
jgi:DNA-binding NarL/FixJ family response regulator